MKGLTMEVLIKNGDFEEYFLEVVSIEEHFFDFKVYHVMTWNEDNTPDFSDKEIFLSGHIKWDGCSDLWFGDKDKYLHLCGKKYFDDLKNVLDAVWDYAEKNMKNFDKETAY